MAKVIEQAKNTTIPLGTQKSSTLTKVKIEAMIKRPLSSPINSKDVGQEFDVTLTGEVAFSSYNGRVSAHLLTVEGYKLAVNASFNPAKHKAGAAMKAVCREAEVERDGKLITIKFSALID